MAAGPAAPAARARGGPRLACAAARARRARRSAERRGAIAREPDRRRAPAADCGRARAARCARCSRATSTTDPAVDRAERLGGGQAVPRRPARRAGERKRAALQPLPLRRARAVRLHASRSARHRRRARSRRGAPGARSRGAGAARLRRARGEQIGRLEPAARERELLRLWTRYEAELKRQGLGFAGGRGRVEEHASVVELDLGDGCAAALATERPASVLRLWRFA